MLDRVQQLLEQATPATRCLITVALTMPFYLTYLGMNAWGLADPDLRMLTRPQVLLAMQTVIVSVLLLTVLIALWLWPRRHSPDPMPHVYTVLAVSSTLMYGGEAIIQGHLTTPANIVLVGNVVIGLMLLDTRSVVLAYVQGLIMLVVSDTMILQGIIPYAPLFTAAAFEQNLPQQWFDNVRDFVLVISVFFSCLFGIVLFNQIESQRQMLRKLSSTDVLTGLANRHCFMERLAAESGRAQFLQRPFSLVLLDVDHFKRVNDTYGHEAGDEVLRKIAAVLASCMRCPTDLPARLGGEEFAILLSDTELQGGAVVCERIAGRMSDQGFSVDGQQFMVTVSMGLVECHGEPVEALLELVDNNLYQAKAAGRDRTIASVATGGNAT